MDVREEGALIEKDMEVICPDTKMTYRVLWRWK
jgi:hypothetical protein